MKAPIKVTIYRGSYSNSVVYSKEFNSTAAAASYILRHKPEDTYRYSDKVEVVGASILDAGATRRVHRVRKLVELAEQATA